MAVYTKYKIATEFSCKGIEMNWSVNFVEPIDGVTLLEVKNEHSIDPFHIRSNPSAATTRLPMGINPSPQANKPQAAHTTTDTHNGGQALRQRKTAAGRDENGQTAFFGILLLKL